MSQPRMILPGTTYLITRRVVRRHLLFRPDPAITRLITYALAVSAQRYSIQVHAFCVMSTHLHLVVTDVQGLLPRFLQFFHRIVALGTKVLRAWEGAVWDHEATSVVRLVTREAVAQKIAYTLANPVAAGLVRRACEWPGAKVSTEEVGRGVLRVRRPDIYFDAGNPNWPAEATLLLTLPPCVHARDADSFRRDIVSAVAAAEAKAQEELRRQGIAFLGARRAAQVSPHERATSFEAVRKRNPTIALGHCKLEERGPREAWAVAVATVRAFRSAYRDALAEWRRGVRTVIFPAGTWWMSVFHGVAASAQ